FLRLSCGCRWYVAGLLNFRTQCADYFFIVTHGFSPFMPVSSGCFCVFFLHGNTGTDSRFSAVYTAQILSRDSRMFCTSDDVNLSLSQLLYLHQNVVSAMEFVLA